MPAMGQHETRNIGLKSEIASGVLVDPESQSRSDEVLGASRRVRGKVPRAVRGGRSDGRVEIPLHGDILYLPQGLEPEMTGFHRVGPGQVFVGELVVGQLSIGGELVAGRIGLGED